MMSMVQNPGLEEMEIPLKSTKPVTITGQEMDMVLQQSMEFVNGVMIILPLLLKMMFQINLRFYKWVSAMM